jgi:L-rhamnose-H+ transport protein
MVAGIMSGNCMLPIKFAKRWRWENIWLVFSVMSLLVLPWALAAGLVRDLTGVYRSLGPAPLIRPLLFGAGWGVAQILFGISVRRLGLGVAYAIIVGLGAVLGTLVPLFAGQSTLVKHESLLLILAGVVVMVVGIGLTAWGGQVREHSGRNKPESSAPFAEQGYAAAIAVAVLCGVMAPMLNYAFAFGQSIATEAVRHGSAPVAAAYAVWPIALLGGLLPNVAYCVFLLMRNRSWNGFRSTGGDALWSSLMAVLWMGAFALYGMSAVYLGPLGTSVGWGLFQIFMIMTATLSGLLTAEWHSAPRRALQLLTTGVIGLITATLLLTIGGRQ